MIIQTIVLVAVCFVAGFIVSSGGFTGAWENLKLLCHGKDEATKQPTTPVEAVYEQLRVYAIAGGCDRHGHLYVPDKKGRSDKSCVYCGKPYAAVPAEAHPNDL